ncbi:P-loop containing nucleoside triphosphate hydrolase protein [Gongronella butleri]|nr:P-loop containing nucleoside triphosphate hydrolase protein [Gongronella butleri]
MSLSEHAKSVSDAICDQLNGLYLVHLTVGLIDARAFYIVHDTSEIPTGYAIALIASTVSLLLLSIIIHEERYAPLEPVIADTGRPLSGEGWASIYSQFMFSWVTVLMKLGYRRTLNDEDLIELPPNNRAKNVLSNFRSHRKPRLLASILYTFRWPLFIQFIYSMVWSIVVFGPAYFLNGIINYIEHHEDGSPVLTAYLFVLGLFITNSAQSLALQQALYIGRTLGIRLQSIIIGEVFGKALRRRDISHEKNEEKDEKDEKEEKESGNVNNLLSVDAQKIAEIFAYVFYVYSYPLQIAVCIVALYELMGTAALWGVLAMIVSQPLTYFVSKKFEDVQDELMSKTDKRIKLMTELLNAIRIIKFFAWEREFRQRVLDAREIELEAIKKRLYMFMWTICVWFMLPILIMVVTFFAYTMDHPLTAATAFTALALFGTMRLALEDLPFMVTFMIQANVSINRVEVFLKDDEVDSVDPTKPHPSGIHLGFVDNASFGWTAPNKTAKGTDTPATPTLVDLNISFPRNKMSIVCGPTGAGKSTLLASLLGETYVYQGSAVLPPRPARASLTGTTGIAYVAQSAWLQNASIRDNILFGCEYDEDRYRKVLYITALTRDLDILEHGDATEVGEKGITLSGGQKQRLSIARAVYSQADTIILDDCLSAVDAHTAKHLYDHCLKGDLMRDRTVILVTHYVGLCLDNAAYIVALKDGRIQAAGTPDLVLKSGALGEELAIAKEQSRDIKEETAEDGPIPTVPKVAKDAKGGDGAKLVQDEARAEGAVKSAVYATYYEASGGWIFWAIVVLFFCVTQGSVVAQDYWIKVWASAYKTEGTSLMSYAVSEIQHSANILMVSLTSSNASSSAPDHLADPHQVNVAYYLGVYVLIGVLAVLLSAVRLLYLYMGSMRASRTIHARLLDRLLRAKVRFFDVTPMGRITNRISSDLETVDQEVSPQLSFFLFSIVATVMIVVVIVLVTPVFLIPAVIITVVFYYIGMYYLKTSRDLKRLNSVSRSPIYVQFQESVAGVATIRAYGCQTRFVKENHGKIDANNRPFIWMWATNRWLHCRVDVLSAFVGFCTGFVLVLSREWVDAGLAGLSLSYALQFTANMLWVIRNTAMNEMNMNAVERIAEYLEVEEEAPTHIAETMPRASWPENGSIKVKDLVVSYAPDTPAVLRNISFETKPRERVAIVGRTGSGKSTICLSLFRFMEYTQGSISIDGVDISTIGLHDLRSRITIIPQDPVLFSGNLRTNLDPFGDYDDATLWAALKRSHLTSSKNSAPIDETQGGISVSEISLESPVAEGGKNWSQGQRQLIALARALVKKTALIVLDEATSSVDFDTDRRIQRTIRSEFNDSAVICIAHRLRTIADFDRVLVLDQGEVVEFDTPYALMTKEGGIFKQMCDRSGEAAELLSIARGAGSSQPSSSTTTSSSASSTRAPAS